MNVPKHFERFAVDEGQIEKAIARTCFVQPLKYKGKKDKKSPRQSPKAGAKPGNVTSPDANNKDDKKEKDNDLQPNSVSYEFNEKKQSAFCKITPSIRRRICEVLFDDNQHNVVHFLCDQLLKAPIDCRGTLVNNILLTGGTVQIPGFEARFIQEWNRAMKMPKYKELWNLKHRFRLLPCKFPANIRMFVGASIYGELTSRFVDELFITKDKFEKDQNSRIDDWTEQSVYNYSSTIKNITHAQIVRKPQYRGRPTYNLQRRSMGISSSKYQSRFGAGTTTSSSGSNNLGSNLTTTTISSSSSSSNTSSRPNRIQFAVDTNTSSSSARSGSSRLGDRSGSRLGDRGAASGGDADFGVSPIAQQRKTQVRFNAGSLLPKGSEIVDDDDDDDDNDNNNDKDKSGDNDDNNNNPMDDK